MPLGHVEGESPLARRRRRGSGRRARTPGRRALRRSRRRAAWDSRPPRRWPRPRRTARARRRLAEATSLPSGLNARPVIGRRGPRSVSLTVSVGGVDDADDPVGPADGDRPAVGAEGQHVDRVVRGPEDPRLLPFSCWSEPFHRAVGQAGDEGLAVGRERQAADRAGAGRLDRVRERAIGPELADVPEVDGAPGGRRPGLAVGGEGDCGGGLGLRIRLRLHLAGDDVPDPRGLDGGIDRATPPGACHRARRRAGPRPPGMRSAPSASGQMATSQTLTNWSAEAVARVLPSGETAICRTLPSRSANGPGASLASTSQSFSSRSAPPVARVLPPGPKARARIGPAWAPPRRATTLPSERSQRRIDPSSPPPTSVLPSGANARARNGLKNGLERRPLGSPGHVPEPDRARPVARGQRLAVGAEGEGVDDVLMRVEGVEIAARGDFPELDRVVEPAGGQHRAVGAERQSRDGAGVAGEGGDLGLRGHVPERDRGVLAARGERLAVGAERQGRDGPEVPLEVVDRAAGGRAPRARRPCRRRRWPGSCRRARSPAPWPERRVRPRRRPGRRA